MLLILKAVLAGLIAASVVVLANSGAHRLAGLLISFPVILMVSVFVIGTTSGQSVALDVVKSNILAMPVWLITVAAIAITLKFLPLPAALVISLGVWLCGAWAFLVFTE